MESTTAKVLFVAALFAGITGMVVQSGVAMEKGMGLEGTTAEERVIDLGALGKTILTASAVLFGTSLLAAKKSRGLHNYFSRPRVWSVTIRLPKAASSSTRPVATDAPLPPPPPPRPLLPYPAAPTNYVAIVMDEPLEELIASCNAIRLDPPLQKSERVPVRRSAGRYR